MSELSREEWMRDVLERFERPLLRYALRLVHDMEAARDIVQDTLLRLCQQGQEDVERQLQAWLYRVCHNRAVDHLRKEGRMQSVDAARLEVPVGPGPQEAVLGQDEQERVLACLGGLPERQQTLLRLKFQEGLSYKEMARQTDLSVSNVGFILHQAIRALRERLGAGSLINQGSQS